MKYKGINYDTGTRTTKGGITRETFDPAIVTKEIAIIKNELNCNAIRVSGLHIDRIATASEIALKMGLTVWFSPSLQYESQGETFEYLISGAVAAEKLRAEFSDVIYVAGCELSIFTAGFVKGAAWGDRLKNLFNPISLVKNLIGISRAYNRKLNSFLAALTAQIRKNFRGQITYASGTWEKINWDMFDIIGIDHYRASFNKAIYLKELKHYIALGKPVSIMEFGCCTYKGADDKGAIGWNIVDWSKPKPELKGDYQRDEETQANYLLALLTIFEEEKTLAAFAFTFVFYNYAYDEQPKYDLDMASYGIVRPMQGPNDESYKGLPWLPKLAFFQLGKFYNSH